MAKPLTLYNTLSREKEVFMPLSPPKVGMYTCGPTVYNYAHIGNLRSYIFADILRKTLAYNGYDVEQVMNITDVGHLTDDADAGEDKMEKGAAREGKNVWEIAEQYTSAFKRDMKKLNIAEPTIWCKATAHIKEQIALVRALIEKGVTYETSDGIYFDTSMIDDYGKLARLKPEALEGGKRVDLGEKRQKTDFALWKFSPKEEQRAMEWIFDGPRSGMLVTRAMRATLTPEEKRRLGFPGWHIECSAMSSKYLGEQFDLHTGGIDHIPVHHTNEIAQAETAFGKKPWVKYWMHGEFLVLEKEKMAKSGENFLTLSVLEKKGYDPLDYRYLCLTAHYRQQLTFSWDAMKTAKQSRERLRNIIDELRGREESKGDPAPYKQAFLEEINDDLNVPKGVATLWNALRDKGLGSKEKLSLVKEFEKVLSLGLLQEDAVSIPEEIVTLAEKREKARERKDFKESDRLRDEIKAKGYQINDTKEGWKIKKV